MFEFNLAAFDRADAVFSQTMLLVSWITIAKKFAIRVNQQRAALDT
jgi:hypothetical protein